MTNFGYWIFDCGCIGSLPADVASKLRRRNNGYEGRIGHYGGVGLWYRFPQMFILL
jgi:hypothetical protein